MRYRFMSPLDIATEERAMFPPPTPPPTRLMGQNWHPGGTALDRAPYWKERDGTITYSKDWDYQQNGVPTEAPLRPNTLHTPPR